MKSDDHFWYPFRPAFRWPMRLLGILFLVGVAAEGLTKQVWRWQSLGVAVAFLIWSFQKPEWRPNTTHTRLGRMFTVVLWIFLLLTLLMTVAYFLRPH